MAEPPMNPDLNPAPWEEWERIQKARRFQGKYWARMPNGESCFDVCTRVPTCRRHPRGITLRWCWEVANLFGTIVRDRQPAPMKGRDGIDNVVIPPGTQICTAVVAASSPGADARR